MAKKILNVVETAYRATLEEQDDPVLWLTAALKGNGADVDVLLRGNAVNYLVRGQDAGGLSFGGRKQTQAARVEEDVRRLVEKGLRVFYVEEDASQRGVRRDELLEGARAIGRGGLPELFDGYDHVWHW
jgi:hypothetical protein